MGAGPYGTPDRRLRAPCAAPGGRVLLQYPLFADARDRQRSDRDSGLSAVDAFCTPKPGVGVQNSPICTAQLVIAEAALAAPNGGGVRWLLPPSRGGGQRSVMTLAVIKAAASEAR